jgi:myo-inositol-1(or 4)-monophosphatase
MATREALRRVAAEAVAAPGDYLRREFDRANTAGEDTARDVTADVDAGAERRVLETIGAAFSDHAVHTEASGERVEGDGPGEYRWVADALDGTDNFTAGLPTFSTAVTLLRDADPVVGAVHLPVQEDTYLAARDEGVTYNGDRVCADSDLAGREATVAFVVGSDVRADPEGLAIAGHLRNTIEVRVKRVIESRAPTVHWALLTRGLIEGVVAYDPDREQQYAGELLASEAGVRTREGDGVFLGAANDDVLMELADVTEPVF